MPGQRVHGTSLSVGAGRWSAAAEQGSGFVTTVLHVAYPGEPGSFAEEAALAAAPDVVAIGLPGFREVFEAVAAGHAPVAEAVPEAPLAEPPTGDAPLAEPSTREGPLPEASTREEPLAEPSTREAPLAEASTREAPLALGVLPIENVLGGTIRETYDLLLAHDLHIVGEVVVPVRLCLAALPGERLEGIERVYSHVQALAQAERFLRSRPWTLLTTYNTAAAGRLIVERREHGAAAVLSPRAAQLHGLAVLAEDVEDEPDDRTRFLVVGRSAIGWQALPAHRPMRTTLVFGLRNEPGALTRALAALADVGLNMSKLESRPLRGRAWEYVFWIDLDADAGSPAAAAALDELHRRVSFLRVLGSYPRAVEPH